VQGAIDISKEFIARTSDPALQSCNFCSNRPVKFNPAERLAWTVGAAVEGDWLR